MKHMNRLGFTLFDFIIGLLPSSLRRKIVSVNPVLRNLVEYGGTKGCETRIRSAGFEGKWTESVETVPENEIKLVTLLMRSLQLMKQEQSECPSTYVPAPGWRLLLEDQWKLPIKYIRDDNVEGMSNFYRNFFRNEGLSGFWGETDMFDKFRNGDPVWKDMGEYSMYLEMEILKDYVHELDFSELDAPRIGNPWGYKYRGYLLYEPVFCYFLQAMCINSLVAENSRPVVLEVGGGFGGLAYHLLKRNPNIKYVGLDLPENVSIQAYYISCAFPNLKVYIYERTFVELDQAMLDLYDVVLLPNFCLPKVESGLVTAVVNVRSLAEMSQETISEYLRQVDRVKAEYFYHENIFKDRTDGLHGIPSNQFPSLENYYLIHSGPSRWTKYGTDSAYPCHENIFRKRNN